DLFVSDPARSSAAWPKLTEADCERLPLVSIGPEDIRGFIPKNSEDCKHGHGTEKRPQVHAPRDPEAKSNPDVCSGLHPRKWLFTDIAGDRRPPRHFKGHRVRAPQHARRSRSDPARSAQGTLFDPVHAP